MYKRYSSIKNKSSKVPHSQVNKSYFLIEFNFASMNSITMCYKKNCFRCKCATITTNSQSISVSSQTASFKRSGAKADDSCSTAIKHSTRFLNAIHIKCNISYPSKNFKHNFKIFINVDHVRTN